PEEAGRAGDDGRHGDLRASVPRDGRGARADAALSSPPMSARQKINQLTNSWYGYSLFAAIVSVLSIRATGLFSLAIGLGFSVVINAIGLVVSIVIVTFFGRMLLAGSRLTRVFLVVASGLGAVLGALGTLGAAWTFLHVWSLAAL